MNKKFWDKRIPSFLGLLFLAISVGMFSWFGKNYTELRGKASVSETPGNVQISNITQTSFTISYTTQEGVIGVISYGRDTKLGQVELDDTDRETSRPSAHRVHYITISRLDPGTKYYFVVQSGGLEFLNNNKPYEVTTATKLLESSPSAISVTGSVNLPDGTIPMDGIVYLSTSTSQLLSTLFKIDGTYLLPISSLRTSDLSSNVTLEGDTILQMTIRNSSNESHVLVKAGHLNPIPLVTLSKDYDFTIDNSLGSFTDSQSALPNGASPSGILSPEPSSGFPSFSSNVAGGPNIITPKEREKFIDQQPLFQGTGAIPNAIVVIIIESTEVRTSVEADNFGNWQFRPTTPLSPGQHTITIIALDTSGIQQTIKRSFTVFAQGSQFTEPSVSPTFGPTPTSTPTPTPIQSVPTVSASPIPTKATPVATTTPTPTSLPTATPTPTPIQSGPSIVPTSVVLQTITPTPLPISPPGSSSLLIGGALSVLSLTAGFMLFFLL